jgi:hypothetical protein
LADQCNYPTPIVDLKLSAEHTKTLFKNLKVSNVGQEMDQ